jgi:integrase
MELNPKYEKFFIKHKKITSESDNTVWVVDYDQFIDFFRQLKEDEDVDVLTKGLIALLATGGLRVSEALKLKRKSFEYEKGKLYGITPVLKKRFLVKYKDIYDYRMRELEYKKADSNKKKLYEEVLDKWLKQNRRKITSKIKLEFSHNYEDKKKELISILSNDYSEKEVSRVLDTYKRTFDKIKKNPPEKNIPKRYFIVHDFLTEIVENLWTREIKDRRIPKPDDYLLGFNRQEALRRVKGALGEGLTNHSMRHSFVSFTLFHLKKTTEEVSSLTLLNKSTVENYSHYNIKNELSKLY